VWNTCQELFLKREKLLLFRTRTSWCLTHSVLLKTSGCAEPRKIIATTITMQRSIFRCRVTQPISALKQWFGLQVMPLSKIDEVTDNSHSQHLIHYTSLYFWNILQHLIHCIHYTFGTLWLLTRQVPIPLHHFWWGCRIFVNSDRDPVTSHWGQLFNQW
jgi:hypothetical protein